MTKPTFIMAATAAELRAARPDITVEAEYGQEVVEGTSLTYAHHVRPGPCPCLARPDMHKWEAEVIGLSHIDLDAIGCCAAFAGCKAECGSPEFWQLAALADTKGPQCKEVREHPYFPELAAYWAWSKRPENRSPRMKAGDGVWCVDGQVQAHFKCLMDIMAETAMIKLSAGEQPLHAAGRQMLAAEAALEASSFVRADPDGAWVLRSADSFVNHLYGHRGVYYDAVIGFNTETKAITLSFRDDDARAGRHAARIMQSVFGSKAGGHPGIAGTPRDAQFALADCDRVIAALEGGR